MYFIGTSDNYLLQDQDDTRLKAKERNPVLWDKSFFYTQLGWVQLNYHYSWQTERDSTYFFNPFIHLCFVFLFCRDTIFYSYLVGRLMGLSLKFRNYTLVVFISLLYTLRYSHRVFSCILNSNCLCGIQLELLLLRCHSEFLA
jgi:hypothetical protein